MKTKEKMLCVKNDPAVVKAKQQLEEIEKKLLLAQAVPVVSSEDELAGAAGELLEGGTQLQTAALAKKQGAVQNVRVLKKAVELAVGRLRQAEQVAGAKLVKALEPQHRQLIEALIAAAKAFEIALMAHDSFVSECHKAGLYSCLPAAWSLKWKVLLSAPPGQGGRWDIFYENLQVALHDLR
jgi:hypothetical protein